MGLLVDGTWHDVWYDTKASQGRFVRSESQFRNWITIDGSAGPSGRAGFRAEPGRYHLYVAFACPWAHRTLIMRQLKGLEALISVSATNSYMGAEGWTSSAGSLGRCVRRQCWHSSCGLRRVIPTGGGPAGEHCLPR